MLKFCVLPDIEEGEMGGLGGDRCWTHYAFCFEYLNALMLFNCLSVLFYFFLYSLIGETTIKATRNILRLQFIPPL